MHRETKATAIPASVKAAVALRDCANGPATCIICGEPGMPCCHVVRRSQGGRGGHGTEHCFSLPLLPLFL